MTWFNPKIYCKQNLNDEDREEFEFWNNLIMETIDSESADPIETGSETLDKVRSEIIADFCETLKIAFSAKLNELTALKIENYDCDVEEVDEPETFSYGD